MHTQQTFRRRQPLWFATAVAVFAVTLVACDSDNTRTDTEPHATPAVEAAQVRRVTNAPEVRFPDLTDPAGRTQFACSFEDGYFTEPQASPDDSASDCP
jgi:hypothetical protein